jgi:hypothetical protein
VAILLTVEGSSEFILWRIGIELTNYVVGVADNLSTDAVTSAQLVSDLKETFQTVADRFTLIPEPDFSEQYNQLMALNITNNSNNQTYNQAVDIVAEMISETYVWVFENLGVEVPKNAADAKTGDEKLQAILSVFGTVFLYFFIAAGSTLILLSVMYYFGKTHKNRGELASIVFRFVIGVGLTLITTMWAAPGQTVLWNFIVSPWILPTVTLSYGLGE